MPRRLVLISSIFLIPSLVQLCFRRFDAVVDGIADHVRQRFGQAFNARVKVGRLWNDREYGQCHRVRLLSGGARR